MFDYKVKPKIFLAVSLMFFGVTVAPAFAESIVIGGKNGWQKLSARNGVTETKGRFGHDAITLATNSQEATVLTDMLIDFDNNSASDRTGNYRVMSNAMQFTSNAMMGNGAALSKSNGGLVLYGNEGSIFGTAGRAGSFTISFWLSPSTADGGEVIFNWRSSRTGYSAVTKEMLSEDEINYQQINAIFTGGVVEWSFYNIFDGSDAASNSFTHDGDIRISGKTAIIPTKWSFHVISFNEENGMLEYRVNGNIEAITYITTNGRGTGHAYPVYIGAPSEVEICPSYTGKIDDFKIERSFFDLDTKPHSDYAPELMPAHYKITGGRIETDPILAMPGSKLNNVVAEMNLPSQTAIRLYVRSGDNYFGWTAESPAWKPISSGEQLRGVEGRYFQIAADLFPDGSGSKAPTLTSLTVDYTPPEIPLPPFVVNAEAGNRCVTLTWSHSVDDSTGGYYVYYGTRPGEYLGRTAVQGASPVNVGNTNSVTLTGLQNNTIYYFAIAAWSRHDDRIVGDVSKEVYARPAVK